MRPLSNATEGENYTISWMMCSSETGDFLKNSDIREGSVLHMICHCAHAVLFSCHDRRFILDDEAAKHIQVTPCL